MHLSGVRPSVRPPVCPIRSHTPLLWVCCCAVDRAAMRYRLLAALPAVSSSRAAANAGIVPLRRCQLKYEIAAQLADGSKCKI